MKIITGITFFVGFWCTTLPGQDCFRQLANKSGTEFTSGQLSELEQAACDLIDSLPSAYQDSFAVLDFGFYLHNRSMDQGVEEVWQEVIQQADSISPYYLLLGRMPGREWDVKVEMKWPWSGIFSCLGQQQRNYLIESTNLRSIGNLRGYVGGVQNLMGKLELQIQELKNCCELNLVEEMCSECPNDIFEFRTYLENSGFVSAPLQGISIEENEKMDGVVKSYHDIICTLPDGTEVDINQDVGVYLNNLASKVEGIKGNIAHYDAESSYCEAVIEIIRGKAPLQLKAKRKDQPEGTEDRYLLEMDVITTKAPSGAIEIHVKTSEKVDDLTSSQDDCGTIYLINDGSSIDMNQMIPWLDSFYRLLMFMPYNNKTPNLMEVNNKLKWSDLGELDAVCILGTDPSGILEFIHRNYKKSIFTFNCSLSSLQVGQIENLENESSIKVFSWVNVDVFTPANDEIDFWEDVMKIYTLEKSAALLVLHATTHNTGLRHTPLFYNGEPLYPSEGYFSHENRLNQDLIQPRSDFYGNMEKLLEFSKTILPADGVKVHPNRTLSDWLISRFVKN